MHQHWRWLTFFHWRYPPDQVARHLPEGMTVDTWDGYAWVGLVPFLMDRVRPPGAPALPWLSRFPETNVRTYVRGPDGEAGIWFFSLDAGRLAAVLAGLSTYGLPYRWSSMRVERDGDQVAYRMRRRWPGPSGARCDAQVTFTDPIPDRELAGFDHYLTARHRLYSRLAGRLVTAAAEHPPWRLRRARVETLRQNLLQAGGLPAPEAAPVVHAADGTAVRIGMWRPAGNN